MSDREFVINDLKSELECDDEFIKQLDRFGMIDKIVEAEEDDRDDLYKEVMETYRDYIRSGE